MFGRTRDLARSLSTRLAIAVGAVVIALAGIGATTVSAGPTGDEPDVTAVSRAVAEVSIPPVVAAGSAEITEAPQPARTPDTPAVDGRTASEPEPEPETQAATNVLNGRASWYGPGFAGQTTANGETYNPGGMTAAHKSLPMGTTVRVTNEYNGATVTVRINDRGPYSGGRILDVSSAAANALGMKGAGVVPVTVEVLG